MGRSSRAVADQHREELVDAASHAIRGQGIRGFSIEKLMGAAALTKGGFYRHFSSKEALLTEAVHHAFTEQRSLLKSLRDQHPGDRSGVARALLQLYISKWHTNHREDGCPIAALSGEIAREPLASGPRKAFLDGLEQNLNALASAAAATSEVTPEEREHAILTMVTAVGATVVIRATAGSPASDEIAEAVLKHFTPHEEANK